MIRYFFIRMEWLRFLTEKDKKQFRLDRFINAFNSNADKSPDVLSKSNHLQLKISAPQIFITMILHCWF